MRPYMLIVVSSLLLVSLFGLQFLASSETAPTIEADVDIVPDVFNLKQEGVITAYVSNLRKDSVSYDVHDINMSTIGLYNGEHLITKALRTAFQDDVLIVKFDSYTVADYIWTNIVYHMGTVPPQADLTVTLTVRGQLISDGKEFAGSDTIGIILP